MSEQVGGAGPEDESLLIEEAAAAWRPARLSQPGSHPAWHDLSPAARRAAFTRAAHNRKLEAALDPEGMNSTVRAVLEQILQAGGSELS